MTYAGSFSAPPGRAVYCNRTLNMRGIQVLGFDMDYTLVHYDVQAWETRAYAHVQRRLAAMELPVADMQFDATLFARGLILDLETGNIVKANRFGYVTQASHGTRLLAHEEQRRTYSQVWVDLSEDRWVFLNTLFSISEACLYGQLVDRLDAGKLGNTWNYRSLYSLVGKAMDAAHLEGELKAEIIADPARFVVTDHELIDTLLDLKQAGKRLFLATNSEWAYTRPMMEWAFGRHLPNGDWRSLFDLVVVQARKPTFFDGSAPFHLIDEADRTWPSRATTAPTGQQPTPTQLLKDAIYSGGNAQGIQDHFGVAGESILYVGDHVYADIHVSSRIRRWRTALILRELELEVQDEQRFAANQQELLQLMTRKERIDHQQASLRLALQRREHHRTPPAGTPDHAQQIHEHLRLLRAEGAALDEAIAPLARAAGELGHARWGPLMRAGNDKSRLARQIERHADVYTSRVSNFQWLTPFGYLRAARGSLPHDMAAPPSNA
jgi:HAD superfamily 5'-nucleotidase-like hydrolase